jgi:hypothetical protein
MQVLLIVGQMFPFDNREHDNPHVGGPELLENPVTKELKVPGVFDIYLAPGWATNMFWKKVPGPWAKEFIFSEKQNCQGKYVYPSHTFLTKLVSRGSTSLLV